MTEGFDITSFADGIGTLMTAGAAIVIAIVGGNGRIAPPVPEAALIYRLACLIAVLTAILVRFSGAASMAGDQLSAILLKCLIVAAVAFFLYLGGRLALTIRCDHDPEVYLAGIWKKAGAKAFLRAPGGPPDVRDFFCNNDRNAAAIWSRPSLIWSGLVLSVLYAVLIAAATAALSLGWMLANHKDPPLPPVENPRPPSRTITLPADVLFEFNSAELTPHASRSLSVVAARLRAEHAVRITIAGHTDSRGSERSNLLLSERRASAVYQWLAGSGCLDPSQITARGYGASQPVAPNIGPDGRDYPEGRARNRRVELRYELPLAEQVQPNVRPCPVS